MREHHPGAACALVLCDVPSQGYQTDQEAFDVYKASDIASQAFHLNTFRYDVLELSTSIKAIAFTHFFENGYDEVIFLDPDLYFYSPLVELDALFESGTQAILTPHVLGPLTLGLPASQALLRDGAYNLGFLALAKCDSVLDFLKWWAARLDEACLVAPELGFFTDQKWCDLLPSFIEKTAVLRHPGYNLAYWNLHERSVEFASMTDQMPVATVNGVALRFVHYSGATGLLAGAISKHAPNLKGRDFPQFEKLLNGYLRQLRDAIIAKPENYRCDYDVDPSGYPIPRTVRQLFREELSPKFDPTTIPRDAALKVMIDYALEPTNELPQDGTTTITRFMHRLWQGRTDLRAAFDLTSQTSRVAFCLWYARAALGDLKLPELYGAAQAKAVHVLRPSVLIAIVRSFVTRSVHRVARIFAKQG